MEADTIRLLERELISTANDSEVPLATREAEVSLRAPECSARLVNRQAWTTPPFRATSPGSRPPVFLRNWSPAPRSAAICVGGSLVRVADRMEDGLRRNDGAHGERIVCSPAL